MEHFRSRSVSIFILNGLQSHPVGYKSLVTNMDQKSSNHFLLSVECYMPSEEAKLKKIHIGTVMTGTYYMDIHWNIRCPSLGYYTIYNLIST